MVVLGSAGWAFPNARRGYKTKREKGGALSAWRQAQSGPDYL